MRAVDIIIKKRDGLALSKAEIEFFVNGYTRGDIPDYQASAWAMAVRHSGHQIAGASRRYASPFRYNSIKDSCEVRLERSSMVR